MEQHEHHHEINQQNYLNKAFIFGIILNSVFVVAEFIAGIAVNSVGLLSDAGHNLSDVASLALAMFAFHIARKASSSKFTYGYKKGTILVSLINAVVLMVAVAFIIIGSIKKFADPQPVNGGVVSWVAAIGVVVNGVTAWLFMKDKDKDLNVKGAYLHMAADALVSIGVVVSGIVISKTGWNFIDPIVGLAISCIIIYSTWSLLRDSVCLALDGVPSDLDTEKIIAELKQTPGVKEIHHIHIWPISTTDTAFTAHIVIDDIEQMENIKNNLKDRLRKNEISHATLEFETATCQCHEHNEYGDAETPS